MKPTAEQAKAELARLTRAAEELESKATQSQREFEETPTARTHSAIAVNRQLAVNARQALAEYEQRVRDILADDAREHARVRLAELEAMPSPRTVADEFANHVAALVESFRGDLAATVEKLRVDLGAANERAREAVGIANTLGTTTALGKIELNQAFEVASDAVERRCGSLSGYETGNGASFNFGRVGSMGSARAEAGILFDERI